MHFGKYHLLIPTLIMVILGNTNAVPPVLNYAGQVTVNGEAFDGVGLFKFALVNADGNESYWSNDGTSVDGSEPQASVSVPVNGGLYAVLLGNTAQQGMGAIDPAVLVQHTDAKLRVWFSDGVNGFQQLSPDRPFASVPYAFSAGTAQTASSATIADGSIDRSMLSEDIISDLNRTITHNDLSPQIKADINAAIGLDRLSAEVILKLEQNATITNGYVTGSKMADGAVTASKIASKTIGKDQISDSILKYLKPEITSQPQASTIYSGGDGSVSFSAEGKYLTYQWKKDGVDLAGETNATINITDANATLHDGNYSVVVSNDFGSVESPEIPVDVNTTWSANGLVGWWPLDGNSNDISGNANHGSLHGPVSSIDRFGDLNSSYYFDGINDYINLGRTTDGLQDFSISLYVKTNQLESGNLHGNPAIIGVRQSSGRSGDWNLACKNGILVWYYEADSSTLTISEKFICDDEWHYLIFLRQHNQFKFYVDGESESIFFGSNSPLKNDELDLGRSLWSDAYYYKGLIDDVRIYDRALSDAEVQALYNLGQ